MLYKNWKNEKVLTKLIASVFIKFYGMFNYKF